MLSMQDRVLGVVSSLIVIHSLFESLIMTLTAIIRDPVIALSSSQRQN